MITASPAKSTFWPCANSSPATDLQARASSRYRMALQQTCRKIAKYYPMGERNEPARNKGYGEVFLPGFCGGLFEDSRWADSLLDAQTSIRSPRTNCTA